MNKKNIPELRFPGFENEWEQFELKDIIQINSGRDYKHLEPGNVPVYGTGGYMLSVNEALSESQDAIGIGRKGTIDKPFILKAPFWTVDTLFYAIPNTNIDLNCLYCLFQRINWKKEDESTGVPSLSKNTINRINSYVPELKEQIKIGSFFRKVDNILTLHQKKLDDLKELKSGLLQKMFPQRGEKVPQIRFPGFTDEWEQRKAADLFESYADKGHPELPVLSATQEFGMVYRDETGLEIHHDTSNEAGYKRVLPGQFVIHLRSFQGGFAHSSIEGITSPAYTIFGFKNEEDQSDIFWKYVFSSKAFIKRLETVTYGIRDGRSISYSDFLGLKFMVPSKEEQERISEFFLQLDQTITLHQKKIDDLNRLKSGLLQKMFI